MIFANQRCNPQSELQPTNWRGACHGYHGYQEHQVMGVEDSLRGVSPHLTRSSCTLSQPWRQVMRSKITHLKGAHQDQRRLHMHLLATCSLILRCLSVAVWGVQQPVTLHVRSRHHIFVISNQWGPTLSNLGAGSTRRKASRSVIQSVAVGRARIYYFILPLFPSHLVLCPSGRDVIFHFSILYQISRSGTISLTRISLDTSITTVRCLSLVLAHLQYPTLYRH